MPEVTPDEQMEINLDTLRIWAEKHATSRTQRFDDQAEAAEIVLSLLDTDQIGYSAPEISATRGEGA